ncbi:MAG: ExbD/TolR family protein [Planctomycetaceae bacterium]
MPLVRLSDDEDPAPNLAPMIDVILVLTIFFMCATKFDSDERSFDLDLPQAGAAAAAAPPHQEVVEVQATGEVRLGSDTVALEDLAARLEALRADHPDVAVTIRGERAVPHGRMAEVYEACQAAGVRSVAIAVRSKATAARASGSIRK